MIAGRIARRLLDAPATRPEEATLGPALDALGGEVVRLRTRDGLRLGARWFAPVPPNGPATAIVLLHGWSGSVAPDLVEYGPWLRTIAGVLGLDFRGHGASDPSPTTFGLREVDDVAAALAWLGERGVTRVALVGTSMGGITALAAAVVLGDGRRRDPGEPPGPEIVAIVADSVAPDLPGVVANRLPGPPWLARRLATRAFVVAARRLGGDPRATEPIRIIGLLEDLPVLLVHGLADRTVPIEAGRRLAAAGGSGVVTLEVAGADHSLAHATDPSGYEARVGAFLREALGILPATPGASGPRPESPIPQEADPTR